MRSERDNIYKVVMNFLPLYQYKVGLYFTSMSSLQSGPSSK